MGKKTKLLFVFGSILGAALCTPAVTYADNNPSNGAVTYTVSTHTLYVNQPTDVVVTFTNHTALTYENLVVMYQAGNRDLDYSVGVSNLITSAAPEPATAYKDLGTEALPNSYMFGYAQGLSTFVLPPFGSATVTMTIDNSFPYQALNDGDCGSTTGDFSVLAFDLGTDSMYEWNNDTGQIIECNSFSAINP